MKKILIPIYFLLFLGSILVIVIGSNKKIDIEFYTIKEIIHMLNQVIDI